MKLVNMGMAFLLTVTMISVSRAQTTMPTTDDIVNKYVDAVGGKDKLGQMKTKYMENTTQVMGNEGPNTVSVVDGVGYKNVSEVNGQSFIQVFTDKGGWQVNPYAGATTPTPLPDELYKQGKVYLDITFPLYNYSGKGYKVELLGKEGNDYKLKVTTKDSAEYTVFIDGTTYYMNKLLTTASMMGQTMEVTSTFSNFKKDDQGFVFPRTVEVSYGGQFNITITVNKIEVNKTIDPSIFAMPKS
jgi:outer membrane lipoprotein-sorting protein